MRNEDVAERFEHPPHLQAWLAGRLPPPVTWVDYAMEPYAPAKKPARQTSDLGLWEAKLWGALRHQWESVKALAARSGLTRQQTRRACRALHHRHQIERHDLPGVLRSEAQVFYRKKP